jgi:Tfp pilus assembly protein PilN
MSNTAKKLVNLLPHEYQKKYKIHLTSLYIRAFVVVQGIFLIIIAAGLAGLDRYYAHAFFESHKNVVQLEEAGKQFNIDEIRTAATVQNSRMKVAADIIAVRPRLSVVIDEVARLIPANVTIDSIDIDGLTPNVDIKGRAQSREQVVAFQNRLEGSKLLKLTFAPLSNLTQASNSGFEFVVTFDAKAINTISQ